MRTATAAITLLCGLAFSSTTVSAQKSAQQAVQEAAQQGWEFVPIGPPTRSLEGRAVQKQFGAAKKPSTANREILRRSIEGINFIGSNDSRPPDTNAAVGNDYIIETTNVQLRIWNRTLGNMLVDQPLADLFRAPSGGDPYVLYDDRADRWYIIAFDSDDTGLFLSISFDGNPLHGFMPAFHLHDAPFPAGFPDYPKPGFNKDAIFISFNDFANNFGGATIVSIDKLAAFTGQLRFFVAVPDFQFRGVPPAQMHDDGDGVEWFVSTDGTDAGGTTIRVTQLTNYLSNNPTFTYTHLPVAEYRNAPNADQPSGNITTFPNTTTYQVQYHKGHLVTAMGSGTASDGFRYPKTLLFDVDVTGATPTLSGEFVINPGTGIAAQMPSVEMDKRNKLGVTWMESSASEFLSMWVGTLNESTGRLVSTVSAAGAGFMAFSDRIGDYSTTVLDPDGERFWSANEYIGDRSDIDWWRTNIQSFVAAKDAMAQR